MESTFGNCTGKDNGWPENGLEPIGFCPVCRFPKRECLYKDLIDVNRVPESLVLELLALLKTIAVTDEKLDQLAVENSQKYLL